MPNSRRNSHSPRPSKEKNPFLTKEEEEEDEALKSHRGSRSSEARPQRFSLQDMEYPDVSIPLDSHPILDEAILNQPDYLQKELGSALGLFSEQPSWLRTSFEEEAGEVVETEDDRVPSHIHPHRRSLFSHIYSRRNSESPQDQDHTHEIPMITLNTTDISQQRTSPSHGENSDLEAGTHIPSVTPMSREFPSNQLSRPPPVSPSKIPGFITRITDRIAGTDIPQTPATERNFSVFQDFNADDAESSPVSLINGTAIASSTSLATPSSPGLFHRSSMESIHSYETQENSRSPAADFNQSYLSPFASRVISTSATDIASNSHSSARSEGALPENSTQTVHHDTLHGKSLGIFGPDSRIRNWCHSVLSHKLTNLTVTIIILGQTLLLAHRQWNPVKEHGYYSHGYSPGDYALIVMNCIYTVEIAMKIISYGLYDDEILFKNLNLEKPETNFTLSKFYFLSKVCGKISEIIPKARRNTANVPEHSSNLDGRSNIDGKQIESSKPDNGRPAREEENSETRQRSSQNSFSSRLSPSITPITSSVSHTTSRDFLDNTPSARRNYLSNLLEDSRIKRAVLRDSWQRLDLISVISFWISLLMSFNHWDADHHIMIFRALSCIRIFRLCKLTDGTNMMLRACESCLPQLIDVGIFIACFWVIIGIVGVQSFKSSLSRHCVWTNPENSTETFINTGSYCGSYTGLDGKVYPYLDRAGNHVGLIKGFRCPMYSVCQSGENPYGGTINFDNILQSMQMVFVMISVNTFSDIMYDLTDSDNLAAALFFIVGIFILTVWLMNIFTAIIVTSFKSIQMEAAEEDKSNVSKSRRLDLIKSMFNNDVHSTKVRELVGKKPFLKMYYRFEFIFVGVIFAAFVTQTFRSSDKAESRSHTLYRAEAAYTAILLLEIIIRFMLYVPQIKTFFLSRRNCFDLGLAIITSIIILGPVKVKLGQAYYWLTFFQCARFYRVVLFSSITSDLWVKIFRNFRPIYDLTLFYFILLFLSGIIVARFFEGTVPPEDVDDVQFAMHTLPNALMSLYVVTSTENWADIMYELQEYAENTFQRAVGSMLIVFWFILSNLVVMNIFIAVIAGSLEISIEGRKRYQVRHFIDDMTERLQTVKVKPGWVHKLKTKAFKPKEEKNMEKAITNLLLSGRAVTDFIDGDVLATEETRKTNNTPSNRLMRWWDLNRVGYQKIFKNPFYFKRSTETDVTNFNPAEFATRVITERRKLIADQDSFLKENPNFNTVFYMFRPRHKLRRFCQRIVPSSFGERIDGTDPNKTVSDIFSFLMFLSTIGLVVMACFQTPLYRNEMNEKHGKWNWTFYVDTFFQGIFTVEFIVKVIADGLIFTPNAYYRSPWNWLDYIALNSLWIEFIAFLKDDSELSRIVRGLKALRALRLLTISETARNNFHYTMISGFGKIMNAGIISLTLLLPFSVWGLNIFNGRLGYCLDGSSSFDGCLNEYENQVFNWNVVSPNVYVQPELYMDDFSSSFSSLYQIVSLEGWVDLLINVMQSTGKGSPQQMFATPVNGLFVIFFNFVSTIFILTLFVSVIINNYSKVTGKAYLTPVQVQWYHVKKFLLQVKPMKRKKVDTLSGIRKFCYQMTVMRNKTWGLVLNLMLTVHVFVLLLEAFPTIVSNAVRYTCFVVVSSCFLVHYIMFMIAQKYKVFVSNRWNVFAAFVALGAWMSTISALLVDTNSAFNNFNKLFLVGLMIFIFPRSDRLNQLLRFASASFPSLFSLIFTWFVMFLMYAIALNQIFGMTKIGSNTTGNINLRSVPKSLVLLFRCSFGEGWNYIMDDFMLAEPFCKVSSASGESDCGSKQYAYVLFMSWNVISMYIMLNLFVSLILDSFSYIAGGKEYSHLISRPEIRKFKRCWQNFDPEGTGFIPPENLSKLLHSLEGSLSLQSHTNNPSILELCSEWIKRNNLGNPYDIDIDLEKINDYLMSRDSFKLSERRKVYEHFIEKMMLNMELHEEPGISFSKLLVHIPLFSAFNQSECLIFIDYMEADLLEKKVIDKLRKRRCYELMEAYVCRWRFQKWKKGDISSEEFLCQG